MQYLIAYILSDPVATFHRELTAEISNKFNIADVAESIPPHLTLKSPFSVDSTASVQEVLSASAREFQPASLTFSGFDHFDERVLYLDVTASSLARQQIDVLTERLREDDSISLSKYDDPITLHATVARASDLELFKKIKEYLEGIESPNFTDSFDGVSLLVKKNDTWKKVQHYPFT